MVNLNRNKKSSGKGGSGWVAPENVYGMVMAVHDSGTGGPNPKDDTIEFGLLADAFGLEAKLDADGMPLTILKARIAQDEATKARRKPKDPNKTLTEMWDLKTGRKKGTGDRMGKNPLIILEKAKLNAAGEIEAQFIFIAARDRDSEKELVIENVLSSVLEEGEYADGNRYQKRKMYLAEESAKVASLDELKAALLEKLKDDRGHKPFAVIRVVEDKVHETEVDVYKTDDDGEPVADVNGELVVTGTRPRYPYEARAASVYIAYDQDKKPLSAEASIEEWFANPPRDADAEMADIIQAYLVEKAEGHEGLVFEVIGGFTYSTGKQSLPSSGNRLSDHWAFQIPWENTETGLGGVDKKTGKEYVTQGVSRAHMVLGRVEDNENPGTFGPWYAQKTFTTKASAQDIFLEREIVTPHTPPQVAALFQAQAERRDKAKRDKRFQANNKDAAPREDDNIPVEDSQPAYDGGMAMSR